MNVYSYINFIPCSLPLELVKALPSQQRVVHRLIYRCSPVLEHDSGHSATTKFIQIEVPLIDNKQAQYPVGLSDFTSAVFWSGTSANVDILMPDRYDLHHDSWCGPNAYLSYMDLRFNIMDMSVLPSSQQPGELTKYLDGLQKL